jgi:hypothetical protein
MEPASISRRDEVFADVGHHGIRVLACFIPVRARGGIGRRGQPVCRQEITASIWRHQGTGFARLRNDKTMMTRVLRANHTFSAW